MPPYQQPPDQWFGQQLAALKRDIAALKAQQTQFVIDAAGTAQAIVGNLVHDPSGNATGLSGFGIAAWNGSKWMQVPGHAGSATVTWAGGNQFTASVTQAHGLGRLPVAIGLTTESPGIACWAQLIAPADATNIYFNAQAPSLPAAGNTAIVHWLAG